MCMDICSLYKDEMRAIFSERGEPSFRADQLFGWLHSKRVVSYDEMTNLPLSTRSWLSTDYPIPKYYYPEKDMRTYYLDLVKKLEDSISQDDFELITHRNFEKLFG